MCEVVTPVSHVFLPTFPMFLFQNLVFVSSSPPPGALTPSFLDLCPVQHKSCYLSCPISLLQLCSVKWFREQPVSQIPWPHPGSAAHRWSDLGKNWNSNVRILMLKGGMSTVPLPLPLTGSLWRLNEIILKKRNTVLDMLQSLIKWQT